MSGHTPTSTWQLSLACLKGCCCIGIALAAFRKFDLGQLTGRLRGALVAGAVYDRTSPVQTFAPLIYLDIKLTPGSRFTLPGTYSQQAVYSVTPGLRIDGMPLDQHRLAALMPRAAIVVSADEAAQELARCVVIGGEPVGDRHKWWNFVST